MKRSTILLLVSLIAFSAAFAASEERNGNWWRQQDAAFKISYVLGMWDGVKIGNNFSRWDLEGSAAADDARKRVDASYDHYTRLAAKVTTGQVCDGLDAFYEDYRNRSINIQNAFWAVLKRITGTPEQEVDTLILNLRKSATEIDH